MVESDNYALYITLYANLFCFLHFQSKFLCRPLIFFEHQPSNLIYQFVCSFYILMCMLPFQVLKERGVDEPVVDVAPTQVAPV